MNVDRSGSSQGNKDLGSPNASRAAAGPTARLAPEAEPSAAFTPGLDWQPEQDAPRDGSPIWGFLNESGIRALRWMSPAECAAYEGYADEGEYDGCWVEAADEGEDWSPDWWLPIAAVSLPPGTSTKLSAAIAKALGREAASPAPVPTQTRDEPK